MNYYEILGLSRNSEAEVIEAAYRALMKKYHPDRWSGNRSEAEPRAKLINEAYATLRDSSRRLAYDKKVPRGTSFKAARSKQQAAVTAKSRSPRAQGRAHRNRLTERKPEAKPPYLNRSGQVSALIICLALMALVVLRPPSLKKSQITDTQTVELLPAQSSLLGAGREQTLCITNKTLGPVSYTLYWGDTNGRQYVLKPGYYMIHFSGRSAAPMIEFFNRTTSAPARNILSSRISRGEPSCNPNYSFQYENADFSRWSQYDQFGLYRDPKGAILPPPDSPGAKS
ncbi:MAG: J domain-containing protein [Luteimonas sp.]